MGDFAADELDLRLNPVVYAYKASKLEWQSFQQSGLSVLWVDGFGRT
jgi:hypothetical protein